MRGARHEQGIRASRHRRRENTSISPAFVRRVTRDHGSGGIAALYRLPTGDAAELEYLLRRFKGFYYRRRYPNISLIGVE